MFRNHFYRFLTIILACTLFVAFIPKVSFAANYQLNVGDRVRLVGTYTASSDGTGKKYSGLYDYYIIDRIVAGRPNPYALRPIDKSWVDGWASSSDILPDYTKTIGASFLQALQLDFYVYVLNDDPMDAVYQYYQYFNHYGKYDVKIESCWNNLFSVPFPGRDAQFVFNDLIVTPEDLGNYLYGLTGSYIGLSSKLIHQGAGYAKTGNFDYVNRPDLYYGDDENDYRMIEMAISNPQGRYGSDLDLENFPTWLLELARDIVF